MAETVCWGVRVDPVELRALADCAGEPDFAERVAALDRAILRPDTLASPPEYIAERLRVVAAYVERSQRRSAERETGQQG